MTRASETSMSNEQRRATAFKPSVRSRHAAEPSRNYARVPGYKENTRKRQEKDEKRKKNERRRNQYARVRRYKITSTLGLLVRGDPQNEGLRGLQPRALGSKLDYFHAGITSTRLHRQTKRFFPRKDNAQKRTESKNIVTNTLIDRRVDTVL